MSEKIAITKSIFLFHENSAWMKRLPWKKQMWIERKGLSKREREKRRKKTIYLSQDFFTKMNQLSIFINLFKAEVDIWGAHGTGGNRRKVMSKKEKKNNLSL